MKAATIAIGSEKYIRIISIHAAREGGDLLNGARRGKTHISIHAAREGGDFTHYGYAIHKVISIHAAREGGDCNESVSAYKKRYFNPRRP